LNAIAEGIKIHRTLELCSTHVKANIYTGYPIPHKASVKEMNQHYHSPTSACGFPDIDQIFHGSGLAEEKAVAARRKNAEAQKMYRIRKKEHEQYLEMEGVYLIVFSLDVFLSG
jgi:hypothetical protein